MGLKDLFKIGVATESNDAENQESEQIYVRNQYGFLTLLEDENND